MAKIYVGNLPFSASEAEVRTLFSQHGTVESVALPTDRETGRPRGFGFVEMPQADAARAIQALNGFSMNGRPLRVNEAQDKPLTGGGRRWWWRRRRWGRWLVAAPEQPRLLQRPGEATGPLFFSRSPETVAGTVLNWTALPDLQSEACRNHTRVCWSRDADTAGHSSLPCRGERAC